MNLIQSETDKQHRVDSYISCALRHIEIDSKDYDLFSLNWQDRAYVDIFLPFGYQPGSQNFHHTGNAVRFALQFKRYKIMNYVEI